MYTFKTITVEDWKHAVEDEASERAKKLRHRKLAIKALKELSNLQDAVIPGLKFEFRDYDSFNVKIPGKAEKIHFLITQAKIFVWDGKNPIIAPDYSIDTNLKTAKDELYDNFKVDMNLFKNWK